MGDLTTFWAARIKAARKESGLLQSEVAERVGVSQQLVSQWEGGLTRPSDERRILLARALSKTIADLFPYPDDTNGDEQAA